MGKLGSYPVLGIIFLILCSLSDITDINGRSNFALADTSTEETITDDDLGTEETVICELDCINSICTTQGLNQTCDCLNGYASINDTYCGDIDECVMGTSSCDENAVCTNTEGSYECQCRSGYEGNGFLCEAIECKLECRNGDCVLEGNIGVCECNDGYTVSAGRTSCDDVNECSVNSPCDQLCQNLPGSYECQCLLGYNLNTTDESTCIEIDECASDPCNNGDCVDLVNGFRCDCYAGYKGKTCATEINECDAAPCIYGTCNDYVNFYNCTCQDGYTGSNCDTDIDECSDSPCVNGDCQNLINMYQCICDYGWKGTDCDTDIDECASVDLNDCEQLCSNVDVTVDDKGYQCSCNAGYTLDNNNSTCTEIDECDSGPCQNDGTCKDLINSFQCDCATGWTGTLCGQDVDECDLGTDLCDVNSTCTNTDGGYNCTCNNGFRGDGFDCKEIIMCSYGDAAGDLNLRDVRDEKRAAGNQDIISKTIRPTVGFPFWGQFYYNLYFTDNGLIVFTNENGEKYAYPYPFTNGFTTSQTVPMIAVFWDDVDLRLQQYGNIYYKVYDTSLSLTASELAIVDEVNARIRSEYRDEFGSFEASWVLKITWDEVPAFSAYYTYATPNTFQGILVTDGLHSFVIINYKEDAMLWNTAVRGTERNNAIIGYNGGNGISSEIENAQETFPSTAALYKPDQYDGNTGLKGRWTFRVENNTDNTINPKQKCLTWYMQQPDPSTWLSNLGICPCALEQGENDASFALNSRPTTTGNNQLFNNGDIQTNVLTILNGITDTNGFGSGLQSSFANSFGGSQSCAYRSDSSFIDSYESVMQSSNAQRSRYLNSGTFDPSAYLDWINDDILPRYYCCSASSDPVYCELYEEKRPKGTCTGYEPPNLSLMHGDPHIRTLDENNYSFNGQGEYVLVSVQDGYFELQSRTERFNTSDGTLSDATIFTSFAMQQQGSSKVQFTLDSDNADFTILVDGSSFDKSVLTEDLYTSAALTDVQFFLKTESDTNITRTVAVFSSGIAVSVAVQLNMLDAVFSAPTSYRNQTKGLLGLWNGDPSDDFLREDGTYQQPTVSGQNLTDSDYFEFGQTWQIEKSNSLFTYNGDTWEIFNNNSFVPKFLDELLSNSDPTLTSQAISVCGGSQECLFDTLATSDITIGQATRTTSVQFSSNLANLVNYPPEINATKIINAVVGEEFIDEVMVSDPDGDNVVLSLKDPKPMGATLYQNGTFVFVPANLSSVIISYVASDGKTSATFTTEVRLCDCQNGGVCDYDTLIEGSDIVNARFSVVACVCSDAYTGDYCEEDYDACQDDPCYPGVLCFDKIAPAVGVDCRSCPEGLVGNGFKCYDFDECTEGREQDNSTICDQLCTNTYLSYECDCNSGYDLHPDGKRCIDINECERNTDNCHERATCTNTDGSYSCSCNTGFSDTNGDGTLCENIDECATNPCDSNAQCQDTVGSFVCTCNDGYEGTGLVCSDIDECEDFSDDCDEQATCSNTDGSYSCQCKTGYEGNGFNCTNINECDDINMNDCSPVATCMDVTGSYTCACLIGYAGNGRTCQDENECSSGSNDCSDNADCTNTQGSFTCECQDGYTGDGKNCTDINECTDGTSQCSIYATCTNTDGSYICDCQDGYIGNGIICNDVDECLRALDNTCDLDRGYCLNTIGDYDCQCSTGYELDGDNCTDVNECSNNSTCDHGLCQNTQGGFQCSCRDGYVLATDGVTCTDIDDCYLGTDTCQQGCRESNVTRYSCYCFEGFQDDGSGGCEPVTSCSSNCTNGVCYEINGIELCQCNRGYKFASGSSTDCVDIDESTDPDYPHRCQEIVINTEPGYNCSCQEGYELTEDQRTCTDVDECIQDIHNCSDAEVCLNNIGSYECLCDNGFVNISGVCQDIDECTMGTSGCHEFGICTNTRGSFQCQCLSGYVGNGFLCADDNECHDAGTCDVNAVCVNTEGSYNCTCLSGYEGDGQNCTDIDECVLGTIDCHGNAICSNDLGSYTCTCLSGYQGDGLICLDIDECSLPNSDPLKADCHTYASCNNTEGSYECTCFDGYQGNGTICTDIDECVEGSSNCGVDSICNNILGSYTCSCPSGYRRQGAYNCLDINECEVNPDICDVNAECINMPGNYSCECNSGYAGNGTYCADVNECLSDDDNDCDILALCSNYIGSYTCQCLPGYLSANDSHGRICEDYDECELAITECDDIAVCYNTAGSYFCDCPAGYNTEGFSCTDINECVSKPCSVNANERCVNTPGNFTCVCLTGYYKINDVCEEVTTYDATVVFIGAQNLEWVYTAELANSGSVLYQEYSTHIEENIDYLYENSSISEDYLGCQVTSLADGDPYILVTLIIDLLPGSNVTALELENTFYSKLTGRDNNILRGEEYIVPESFVVKRTDINPCIDQTDDCDEKATCIFMGNETYTCQCDSGYEGNGRTGNCTDVDECVANPGICSDPLLQCSNELGGYSCVCGPGFIQTSGFNETCIRAKQFQGIYRFVTISGDAAEYTAELDDLTSTRSQYFINLLKELVQYIFSRDPLTKDYYLNHITVVRFYSGSVVADFTTYHSDDSTYTSDELQSTVSSIRTVNTGNIQVVGVMNCTDIDECSSPDTNDCSSNATCTNTDGYYTCQCINGLVDLSSDPNYPGRDCGELTCSSDYCLNGGTCSEIGPGELQCTCAGFAGDRCNETLEVSTVVVPTTLQRTADTTIAGTTVAGTTGATTADATTEKDTESDDTTLTEVIAISAGVAAGIILIACISCTLYLCAVRPRSKYNTGSEDGLFIRNANVGKYPDGFRRDSWGSDEVAWETISARSSVGHPHDDLDEEERMRTLVNVMGHAPMINERMRTQLREAREVRPPMRGLPHTDLRRPHGREITRQPRVQSEFVRPYMASGIEASEDHRRRLSEQQGRRKEFIRTQKALQRARKLRDSEMRDDGSLIPRARLAASPAHVPFSELHDSSDSQTLSDYSLY